MAEPTRQMEAGTEQVDRLAIAPDLMAELREQAKVTARSCAWVSARRSSTPRALYRTLRHRIASLEHELYELRSGEPTDDLKWLYDNFRLVRTALSSIRDALKPLSRLPAVRTPDDDEIPRTVVLSRSLASAARFEINEKVFTAFIDAAQETEPLRVAELGGMLVSLKIALLELITNRGRKALDAFRADGADAPSFNLSSLITSLRLVGDVEWRDTLEQVSVVHRAFLSDPGGVYPRMDFESRELYRLRVAKIAAHSDVGELDLTRLAVKLAQEAPVIAYSPEPLNARRKHVGYYLIDEGAQELLPLAGYRPPIGSLVQRLSRRFPDETYIIGIEAVTLVTVVSLLMTIVRSQEGFGLVAGAILLILPATQAAVELINYLVTSVLTPHALPKLDFSKAVDPDCATIVGIPTLLINDKQIRQLVDDLEIRYLVNRDPNIFYALLTDLPDTAEPASEQDRRVDLAIQLIDDLNLRYKDEPYGGFYLFHRHRVYNPREGAWMGWERKRGKLLDLNQLLRGTYDPFPVKAGDMARLPRIRYVLTLDSDTQLPRGSAQKLIGTMAHPLNQPLIDPDLNVVTRGYGILQPRVGISVHSASRSRLASIYSGQTGFDIYSRAISDAYQDLYGEGIFTGKGIYDVDALRQVLEHRFPRNALLSHDLIEGAYARAGLASDIEVIDDYPSHYSAYNRRRHRWLRGDWQIVRWIFTKVPDESRRLVPNPISLISRWKIVDNLRRSLVEPATLILLIAGWFWLPGTPKFWTLVTLALLFLPIYFRLVFALIRAATTQSSIVLREALSDFIVGHVSIAFNIVFLAHQALVAIDAIIRTVVRSSITHTRLLEWETATEAELGIKKRTPVDIYLDWVPLLAIAIGIGLIFKPEAAPYALPFLILWCCSKAISSWLNRSPHDEGFTLTETDRLFLREVALRTWRYFAEFSTAENHWLIPDNVQVLSDGTGTLRRAERISPTNLGLLLNSRQAALELGYVTVSEFVRSSEASLASISSLQRQFGHPLNWYDTLTLQPLEPRFVSSVDSGNLVASLWSLKQGCRELLHRPVLTRAALDGVLDYLCIVGSREAKRTASLSVAKDDDAWILRLLQLAAKPPETPGNSWWHAEIPSRFQAVTDIINDFAPWYLPDFSALRSLGPAVFRIPDFPAPANATSFYSAIESQLHVLAGSLTISPDIVPQINALRALIPACRERLQRLSVQLAALAARCEKLVTQIDFAPLVDPHRNLLSVGYDVAPGELNKSCYDLLASEARTATFIAVAKNDATQQSWFRLGRQHTVCEGETVLVSWTGTMFEYLMPVIWMKSHPNTLLDRATRSAVRAQEAFAERRGVPWGISECAYSQCDESGNYQYAAFGVPGLALNVARAGSLVVSPYSSCLALMIDPASALQNLLGMRKRQWLADYGFYESADYTSSTARTFGSRKYILVRCWMAHHQGMSLAAICNLLCDFSFQRWFHADRLVQASELILQERPLRGVRPITDNQPRRVLSSRRRKGVVSRASA